jgi:hypothetical protein
MIKYFRKIITILILTLNPVFPVYKKLSIMKGNFGNKSSDANERIGWKLLEKKVFS